MAATQLDKESVLPLHYQLTEALRREVSTRPAGGQFYTVREISERFKVSFFTATRALRSLVEEDLLYAVQGKGTFVKGQSEPPRAGQLRSILLFLPHPLRYYLVPEQFAMGELLQGVLDEVREVGNLMIMDIPPGADEAEFCISRIRRSPADGIVLLSHSNIKAVVASAKSRRVPFVLLNVRGAGLEEVNNILAEEREGVRQAVRHLASLGHRRIAYVGDADRQITRDPPATRRFDGYRQGLADAGIAEDRNLVVWWDGTTPEPMDRLFGLPSPPTAVFGQNDDLALRTIGHLRGRGLACPDDVSVAGFDDSPAARTATPPLTTVAKPRYEMGRQAVRWLMEIIRDGFAVTGGRQLATELIIRKSTGPVPAGRGA